jgi:hypothetical protein
LISGLNSVSGSLWLVPAPIALIVNVQVRRFDDPSAIATRNQQRIECAAGEQCSLGGPRGLIGVNHVFDSGQLQAEMLKRTFVLNVKRR